MDVTCDRCHTDYDFDDALVSERGTTVKCASCGHRFKVYRAGAGGAPEVWTVRRPNAGEVSFDSMRALQRAIAGGAFTRHDRLSRAGQVERRLGDIPELAPFFDESEAPGAVVPAAPPPPDPEPVSEPPTGRLAALPVARSSPNVSYAMRDDGEILSVRSVSSSLALLPDSDASPSSLEEPPTQRWKQAGASAPVPAARA